MKKIFLTALITLLSLKVFSQSTERIRQSFDFEWKFRLDSALSALMPGFNDSGWEAIQLPHDWSIKMNFDQKSGGSAGYLPGGIGTYRKAFTIPSSHKGRIISILFDGVYHQSEVYINGHRLGFHPYGYTGFEYDLTPWLKFGGENLIAVRVNHSDSPSSRWYSGSGIYRHAWLLMRDQVHVSTWGTYITTPVIEGDKAGVKIVTTIENSAKSSRAIKVSQKIVDSNGSFLTAPVEKSVTIPPNGKMNIDQSLTLSGARRWSIEDPYLYYLETSLLSENKVIDKFKTPFGIRTFKFDREKGFSLNDKHIKLKGMCLHQDAGSLGTALPDRSLERRLQILKEFGCNAIRCSHNPPAPEFLDLCDRMGFVVIDEAFDKWKSGYYAKYFDEWWESDLNTMILRDRNHPSIVLWSIGNELQEAWGDPAGVSRAAMLQDFVHKNEPTRPVMLALQNRGDSGFAGVTDIIGYNYLEPRMLEDSKTHPERTYMITEGLPYYSSNDASRFRTYTPVNPWYVVTENDFVQGQFIWVGADYLGEASWPSKGWPTGLFDLCMFEKPRAAFHRAVWNDKPIVTITVADQSLDIDPGKDMWQWPNLAAHWNFPQYSDQRLVEVRTTTNCDSVELIVNNSSMGKRKTRDYSNNTIVWFIPYKAGSVIANGYKANTVVATDKLITSGRTDHFIASADRPEITADGQDLSHITIRAFDSNGNPVQTDDRKVTVEVGGNGKLLGIDNGETRRDGSFAGNQLPTYFGKALVIVQSIRKPGPINVKISMEGVKEPVVVDIMCR